MSIFTKLLDFFYLDKRENSKNKTNEQNSDTQCTADSINEKAENDTNSDANKITNSSEVQEAKPAHNNHIEYESVYPDDYVEMEELNKPYISSRFSIKGLDLFFIDISREIVKSNTIATIPLMKKYDIDSSRLNQIISDMKSAQIIDENSNILMTPSELEKFIDIYDPSLFESVNGSFDKDIFMCIGEIIYDKGIEEVYSCLNADDVIDYLNVMEKLNILKFDNENNTFNILMDKASFLDVCSYIPDSFSNSNHSIHIEEHSNYDSMTGLEFEQYCSFLLSKNGFENVSITPSTSDHGIDIFAEKNEITYAIQCKCYTSNVGNSSVQQAYTGKCFYKKDIGVVLTNQFFTQQAINEADELGIKLWDREKLDSLIKNANSLKQ